MIVTVEQTIQKYQLFGAATPVVLMVDRSGAHSSDLEAQETAEELCGKTKQASLDWTPYAQRLWNNPHDPMYHKRHETDDQGMAETDMNKFKRIGRVRTHGEE